VVVAHPAGLSQNSQEVDSGQKVLWQDPGDPSQLDLRFGIGGVENQPQPPFQFISEDESGTTPKVFVRDSRGATWNVKWGEEARPSTFATRLAWACGYFAQSEYFVASGSIEGVYRSKRIRSQVSDDGVFRSARFQLRNDSPKYLDGRSWTWKKNPFKDTHELDGLKILMLLVSNWDGKDARDTIRTADGMLMDSNLAVFEDDKNGERRYLYLNDDWGASMGKWGNLFSRSKWDCAGFSEQTDKFVKVREDGSLKWGFAGKHRNSLTDSIDRSDVAWLLPYLGRLTDEQIRGGLEGSGATTSEIYCFARALRRRIDKLQMIAAGDLKRISTGQR